MRGEGSEKGVNERGGVKGVRKWSEGREEIIPA